MVSDEGKFSSKFSTDIKAGHYQLYCYSDIVRHQLVGDAYAPLLRTVPIRENQLAETELKERSLQCRSSNRIQIDRHLLSIFLNMALLHHKSSECSMAELDSFSAPMTQLSIEEKLFTVVLPMY
ncbi:hypothetical protein F2P81_021818 [Scophthalmus maximus]|uniref:Uncharacterized protein n=1 Tax=Scophthalmus maximus TaxID=52904 RepID=A0A6A4RWV6_SCOMX|nr:hypothetical protein F2P81_021818 [Scophthalmus maximus]